MLCAVAGRIKELNLISDYEWFSPWNLRYVDFLSVKDFSGTVSGLVAGAVYRNSRSIGEVERTTDGKEQ